MKQTHIFLSMLIACCISSCNEGDFTSTSSGGVQQGSATVSGRSFTTIEGEVTGTFTITNDKDWLLTGGLYVADGGQLVVEAGSTVYADESDETPLISIRQGGQIIAEGSVNNPIVFTSINVLDESASAGDWGGIIINGRATTNLGFFGESEGGAGFYGGDQASDNSGIIKYTRIEYGGRVLGEENELNGLSLNAVGNGTTLEYIQAYKCSDDGFEFFGGTVNLRYAVSTANEDDAFDWTFGWNGYGQFWVVDQDGNGDNGLEADNNENEFGAEPFSDPVLSNFTFTSEGGDVGVLLRHGTQGRVFNGIVTGFTDAGVEFATSGDAFVSDHLEDESLFTSNVSVFGLDQSAETFSHLGSANNNDTNEVTLDGFVGSSPSSFDPSTINPWFMSTDYRGAVENAGADWTLGWVKNVDGSIRN